MLSDWLFRARSLLRRAKVEEELDSEMRFHVARQVEAYIKAGLAPDEARRRARLEFGGIDQIKEECRDARGVRLVEEAWRDACYGARLLRRRPAFAWTIIAILALGIGANTLVFSVVNAVLLAPLPFRDAGRLVQIRETEPDVDAVPVSPANYVDIRTRTRLFEDVGTSRDEMFNLTGRGTADLVVGYHFSANFFDVLGVHPALGRVFRADEDRPGHDRVALLSHALWQRKFGGDPRSIGAPIVLDGDLYTIIGVMPPAFDYPKDTELWVPLALPPDALQNRARPFLRLVGRLRAGVTVDQARATLGTLAAQLQREHPATNTSRGLTAVSLREGLTGDIRPALLVLLGFVGFILLAACANVATLLIVRAASREHEVTVRMALGAGWSRLVRQLVTESTLLAILGGSAGLALALGGAAWLPAMFPRSVSNVNIPRIDRIAIDLPVLAFTLCATLATALLFGLVPARHLAGMARTGGLQAGAKGLAAGPGRSGLRTSLVGVEVALALLLLVGAGLMTRTFARLNARDLGFDSDGVVTARVLLPQRRYPDAASWGRFEASVVERVRAIPGVEAAGATTALPLSGWWDIVEYRVAGREAPLPGHQPSADNRRADDGYFRAMGIRLVQGRTFTQGDREGTEPVAIVNATLARRHWAGREAVGAFLELGTRARRRVRIVGVIEDVRHFGPADEIHPEIYLPFAQVPSPLIGLAVRSRGGDAAVLAAAVRHAVWNVDAEQPVSYVMTTGEMARDVLAPSRVSAILVSLFALIALALAAVGTYGLLASTVSHRTREIGLRMALGADRRGMVAMVFREAMKPVALGMMGGLIAALALTRLLERLLYGLSPFDPLTFGAMSLAVLIAAAIAAALPARRAASVDPIVALRQE